jgi:hypothetical protein
VVSDFIFGLGAAIVVTLILAFFFAVLWFALPFRYRGSGEN